MSTELSNETPKQVSKSKADPAKDKLEASYGEKPCKGNSREELTKLISEEYRTVKLETEKEFVQWAIEKGHCPKFKLEGGQIVADLNVEGIEHEVSQSVHEQAMLRLFKVHRSAALGFLVNSTFRTTPDESPKEDVREMNGILAVIDSLDPKDAVEGMLAAQMSVTHNAAMKMIGYANRSPSSELTDTYTKNAVKLLDQFSKQMATLDKHRKGGKQTVVVKHVHVHDGGQAVIDSNISTAKDTDTGGRG